MFSDHINAYEWRVGAYKLELLTTLETVTNEYRGFLPICVVCLLSFFLISRIDDLDHVGPRTDGPSVSITVQGSEEQTNESLKSWCGNCSKF